MMRRLLTFVLLLVVGLVVVVGVRKVLHHFRAPPVLPATLTPPSPRTPLIHGPKAFGVRPKSPFLYTIPATGDRPMTFSADHLPSQLTLDPATGQITGSLPEPGDFPVVFRARNALGETERPFEIKVGEEILLTPPMGWNSWNCWSDDVSQEKILRSARALVSSGLSQHGWVYVNVDDAWQGVRGGALQAIQPDPKRFPDIKAMVDEIHGLGLKAGIYSTPWITSYASHCGGSSDTPEGYWDPVKMKGTVEHTSWPNVIGPHHFFTNDARQWAEWGLDYLKFDWQPVTLAETTEMSQALRATGRDIAFSLSNNTTNTLFDSIGPVSAQANCWRITGDIGDTWPSIVAHGFHQDKWAPFARPGHWNDPDMFEVGTNGGGQPKMLNADELYTHVSLWCLLSAPLLLGCDLDHLNDFTMGLLTNDEVLDIDQDTLGKQATMVAQSGKLEVYAKPLDGGGWAVGLFNLGEGAPATVTLNWKDLGAKGPLQVRDLWRQKDMGVFTDSFSAPVNAHGVVLVRLSSTPGN